jgi:hypothetical protein
MNFLAAAIVFVSWVLPAGDTEGYPARTKQVDNMLQCVFYMGGYAMQLQNQGDITEVVTPISLDNEGDPILQYIARDGSLVTLSCFAMTEDA